MPAQPNEPRLFVRNAGLENTVLNWLSNQQSMFFLYGQAFWQAAKELLRNEALDVMPIASFDACVIVYLYRHALELFMKEILLTGGCLIDPRPSPDDVINKGHSLTNLLKDVRRIFIQCGWDKDFSSNKVTSLDDLTAIVDEFENVDRSSFCFRYPVKKDLTSALGRDFTFSIRRFALTMDDVLKELSGACYALPDIVSS
jgi:hypothetical protein